MLAVSGREHILIILQKVAGAKQAGNVATMIDDSKVDVAKS